MRTFAIIPAAGHSRRMGQPKLLLPLGETTVLGRLMSALAPSQIAARIVIVRTSDLALRAEAERHGGSVVAPLVDPPDMRASVEAGLRFVEATCAPTADDAWLLVPADHPVLDAAVIAALVTAFEAQRPRFLVPTFEGHRGHPLLAGWDTAADVFRLPPDVGLNTLVRHSAVMEVPVDSPAVLTDLDTPDDYQRLLQWSGGK